MQTSFQYGLGAGGICYAGCEENAISDNDLLGTLVADLRPVLPLRSWPVLAALLTVWVGTALALRGSGGWRGDIVAGHPAAIVAERLIILLVALAPLLLGALRLGRPGGRAGWSTAAGVLVLGLLPLLALASVQVRGESAAAAPELAGVGRCLGLAVACAMPGLTILMVWARRWGAVTDPRWASLGFGLVAGVSGVAIYSLTCPSAHWLFAGVAYPLAIATITLFARIGLPRLLRW